ncbi:MAG: hypothetical protein WCK89_15310 [bacterium]
MAELELDQLVLRYCRQIIMQAMDHVRSSMRCRTLYLRQPGEGRLGEGLDRLAVEPVRGVAKAGAGSSRLVAPAVPSQVQRGL